MENKILQSSDEQQAELGKKVASLKTYLHDVENHISNRALDQVDWEATRKQVHDLHRFIAELMDGPEEAEEPPPPPPTPTAPKPRIVPHRRR